MADMEAFERFGVWDYVVLAIMLATSSAIGLYYRFTGGKQKTEAEYLLGDRQMSPLPVAFSLMASFMSAITLLGVTNENYSYGTQFMAINVSYVLATPFAAYLYLPVFYRLQSPSAYSYLERRFGYLTRLAASIAFTLQMTLYMGIVVYAPALALSVVTGLDYLGSVLSVGVVCTFYSTMGGMKAVLLTDVFQSILMMAAVVLVVVVGAAEVGGLKEIWAIAEAGGRIRWNETSPDPTVRHTLWTQMIGGIFVYLSLYAVNQAQVQRLLTVRSLRQSQLALWVQLPILMCLSFSTMLAGLSMYAYFKDCDPISAGDVRFGDQLLPLFVVKTMGKFPGLSGLFVAGIFSGSLSTVSSAINSLAAVAMEDYIKPAVSRYGDEEKMTWLKNRSALILKILALFYGAVCLCFTFIVQVLGSTILQAALSIFGLVGGPLLGLFTIGMCTRFGNQPGALTGFVVALALNSWMSFGGPRPPVEKLPMSTENCTNSVAAKAHIEDDEYFYLYRISYAWYALIGFLTTTILGLIVSALTGGLKDAKNVDSSLVVQWICGKSPRNEDIQLDECPSKYVLARNDHEKKTKHPVQVTQL